MDKMIAKLIICMSFVLMASVSVIAAEKKQHNSAITLLDQKKNSIPPITMVEPGVYELGGCKIFKERNLVEFDATVNMKEGLLEYLLVSSAGKTHESLLQTHVEPYTLQIALLLAGFEGTDNPLEHQGDPRMPEGDNTSILLNWQEGGVIKEVPIEECILAGKKHVSAIPWVFTGSAVVDGVFMAQIEKSIIAVYHDPMALIDHQHVDGASDEMWAVDSESLPELGHKVKVIIKRR